MQNQHRDHSVWHQARLPSKSMLTEIENSIPIRVTEKCVQQCASASVSRDPFELYTTLTCCNGLDHAGSDRYQMLPTPLSTSSSPKSQIRLVYRTRESGAIAGKVTHLLEMVGMVSRPSLTDCSQIIIWLLPSN